MDKSYFIKIKEEASADESNAKSFPGKLTKIVEEGSYTPSQVLNDILTGLF